MPSSDWITRSRSKSKSNERGILYPGSAQSSIRTDNFFSPKAPLAGRKEPHHQSGSDHNFVNFTKEFQARLFFRQNMQEEGES